ncbi:MAG: hypothetical protein KKF44_05655 [Nanoarchaeota archaeon]|nr:hypothetical protein [Nanoarchaeota archaeon]
MKRIILCTIFLVFGLILLSACTETNNEAVCNKPYILVGQGCCLDNNDNQICDSDEMDLKSKMNEEVKPTCPTSCDDKDECTKDYCSENTEYKCRNDNISPCCGDYKCDSKENYFTCDSDCEISPTIAELNEKFLEVFKRKNILLVAVEDEEDNAIQYHEHDVLRGIVIEIKDKNRYVKTIKQFNSFVMNLYTRRYNNWIAQLNYELNVNEYSYVSGTKTNVLEEFDNKIIQQSDYTIFYKLLKGSQYTAKKFDGLYIDSKLFVICTPNYVVEVKEDPKLTWYQNFDKKTEEEILNIVDNYITNVKETGIVQSKAILDFCSEKSGYEYQ